MPAQRTVVMLATVGVAWLFSSRIGAATSLALAAALVCLIDPWAVLAPGFWLSFGAVAAIVWVVQGRPMHSASSGLRPVLHAAARVQIAVTLSLWFPPPCCCFISCRSCRRSPMRWRFPSVSWAVTPLALIGAALAMLPAPVSLLAEPVLGAADAIFAIVAVVARVGRIVRVGQRAGGDPAAGAWSCLPVSA